MTFSFLMPDTHRRPPLACEFLPDGIVAAHKAEAEQPVTAFAPLPQGALVPSLKAVNIADKTIVVAALKRAVEAVESRERYITLVVPDTSARVLLLDFDTLPAKPAEALPVVRFRLRKLVPFEVDDAAVSYQIMRQTPEETRVLVTAMPHAVLTEYEEVARLAGFGPGAVLPSTLASLAALTQQEPALVVNCNGHSVTTAITRGEELLLHRTLDLSAEAARREDDLRQAVGVSLAYFEDTLASTPQEVLYAGPGGATELARILEHEQFRVRDLAPASIMGQTTNIPRGLMAGVAGALAS
jgi:type IV pilus assembly protein PilM